MTADILIAASQYHYGYAQHTAVQVPSVDDVYPQAPGMSRVDIPLVKPIVLDERSSFIAIPPGQPGVYSNGAEVDYVQPSSPLVELNVDELLEYQRRRSSATSEEKEPLTPAQRRRKAQNRAAYVSKPQGPTLQKAPSLTRHGDQYRQRAFRDRKRQRVQDLEAQLSALEVRTSSLESDNKRLKHELVLTQNENNLLRSIAQPQPPSAPPHLGQRGRMIGKGGTGQHLPLS